jgi:HSP20 family molecular chaperone IbpA
MFNCKVLQRAGQGVLKVTVPKPTPVQTKKIDIKAAA